MKKVGLNIESPDKRVVKLVVLVFLMAGLPAKVSGQDLGERNAAAEDGAVKVKGAVWAVVSAPDEGESVAAGGSSGSGHVPLNRRTYLRPHPERDTLTDQYFGLGPKLSEAGIESTFPQLA
jgi:hypothetical protein